MPFLAARYYWADMLGAGVKVYQYARGMMHSKYVLVDGEWASVGTANLDNRSLLLNFEVNCQFFDPRSSRNWRREFLQRPGSVRAARPRGLRGPPGDRSARRERGRLFSPIL